MNPSPAALALAEKLHTELGFGGLRARQRKLRIATIIDESNRPLVEAVNELMPHLESDLDAHSNWQDEIEALTVALKNHQPKE